MLTQSVNMIEYVPALNSNMQNNITTWFKGWKERQFYIVPAFCQFNISGLNLVETGHSTMQTSKKLWLSVATWRDTCMMIIQD